MTRTVETPTSLQLTRRIAAPREDVFKAWTDPELLGRWWGPPGTTLASLDVDARVGGRYRIGMRRDDGELWHVEGTYLEIAPPSKLVYTWAWEEGDGPGHESVVTIEFISRGRETDVVLTHERLASEESRDNHRHGWTGLLDQLERLYGQGA